MSLDQPQRYPWAPGCRVMHHFKGYGLNPPSPEYKTLPDVQGLELCATYAPLHPPREIPCRCGEVIWEFLWPILPHPAALYQDFGAVDSEKVSLEEWTAAVEDLVREVEPRG